MPRSTRERIDHTQSQQGVRERAPGTRVVARPVDALVAPGAGEAQSLIEGLAAFTPALRHYADMKDLQDEDSGAAAREQGVEKDDSAGAAWLRGYMRMDNMVKGQQDGSRLSQAYDAWEGKEGGDIESFIAAQVGTLTKGMSQQDVLSYNKGIHPQLAHLRAQHLESNRLRVLEKTETNAMQLLHNAITGYVAAGQPVPDDFLDGYRKELNSVMGVSGKRFNELLYGAVKQIGDGGNFAVYDMFKRPRPDGTPGMYFIPGWKEKIDQAQIHAQSVYLAKQTQARAALKADREERQETALFEVFDLLTTGKEEDARKRFSLLRQDRTLFSRASDIIKWEKLFDDTAKREARPEQQTAEAELMAGVLTGKVNQNDVLQKMHNGDITVQQARRVIGDMSKMRSEMRQAAAAERGAAAQERMARKAIYDTPQFRMGDDFIDNSLKRGANPLDVMGVGTEFDRRLRANAKLRFAQEASTVDPRDANKLNEIRDRVVNESLQQREKWADTVKKDPAAAGVRYTRIDDAIGAHKRGLLTQRELEAHIVFFEQNPQLLKPTNGR